MSTETETLYSVRSLVWIPGEFSANYDEPKVKGWRCDTAEGIRGVAYLENWKGRKENNTGWFVHNGYSFFVDRFDTEAEAYAFVSAKHHKKLAKFLKEEN